MTKTIIFTVYDVAMFTYIIVLISYHSSCLTDGLDNGSEKLLDEMLVWYIILAVLTFLSSMTNLWTLRMIRKRYIKLAASIFNLIIDFSLFLGCLFAFKVVYDV